MDTTIGYKHYNNNGYLGSGNFVKINNGHGDRLLNVGNLRKFNTHLSLDDDGNEGFILIEYSDNKPDCKIVFRDKVSREKACSKIADYIIEKEKSNNNKNECQVKKPTQSKGERTMMNQVKSYFESNKDTYITLAVVILIDHFIFDGAFREKTKDLVDRLLTKTSKKLIDDEEVIDVDK